MGSVLLRPSLGNERGQNCFQDFVATKDGWLGWQLVVLWMWFKNTVLDRDRHWSRVETGQANPSTAAGRSLRLRMDTQPARTHPSPFFIPFG